MTNSEFKDLRGDRTQAEMAKDLGISTSLVKKIEKGTRSITPDIAYKARFGKSYNPSITLEQLTKLEDAAKKTGKSVSQLVSELIDIGLKNIVGMMLFGLVAWQAFAPDTHQFVRKIGRGRKRDDVAMVDGFSLEDGDAS